MLIRYHEYTLSTGRKPGEQGTGKRQGADAVARSRDTVWQGAEIQCGRKHDAVYGKQGCRAAGSRIILEQGVGIRRVGRRDAVQPGSSDMCC